MEPNTGFTFDGVASQLIHEAYEKALEERAALWSAGDGGGLMTKSA
jgi:hypothetical protein